MADTGFAGGTKGADTWDPVPGRVRAAGSIVRCDGRKMRGYRRCRVEGEKDFRDSSESPKPREDEDVVLRVDENLGDMDQQDIKHVVVVVVECIKGVIM